MRRESHVPQARLLGLLALATISGVATGTLVSCSESEGSKARDPSYLDTNAFLDDPVYRRQLLLRSLRSTDNGYATIRLDHYGKDWEDLPVLAPRVAPVIAGQPTPNELEPFAPAAGRSREELAELGQRAFSLWPSQALPEVELALRSLGERAPEALGLWRDAQDRIGALVWVDYGTGIVTVAATCATCHATVQNGAVVFGPPADVAFGATQPGTVDVTADETDNPVAIPDLRLLGLQRGMHWEQNLDNDPGSLAVRVETLLITNAGGQVRPPREVALGLTRYLETLSDSVVEGNSESAAKRNPQGARLFAEHCARCHFDEAGAGDWVAASVVGTDAQAANSKERGTGGYRTPTLLRVAERSRFLHTAYEGSLADFLDHSSPKRVAHGHAFGAELETEDSTALIDYLATRFSVLE